MKKIAVISALLGVIAMTACASQLSLSERACPCISGNVCCNAVCVEGDHCPNGQTENKNGIFTDDSIIGVDVSPDDATGVVAPCMTLAGHDLVWMDEAGKLGGIDLRTLAPITIASFPLPADPVAKCGFTSDADHIYVTLNDAGTLLALSLANGTLGLEATRFGTFVHPAMMTSDDANIFVIEGSGRVSRIAKPTTSSQAEAVPIGQANPDAHDFIAVDDSLFWLDESGLWKLPKVGGQAQVLAAIPADARSLLAVNGNLFWAQGGLAWQMPEAGGKTTALTVQYPYDARYTQKSAVNVSDISVPPPAGKVYLNVANLFSDGTQLYAMADQDTLVKMGFDGGNQTIVTVDDRLVAVDALYVDASRYIWVSDGAIYIRPGVAN